MSSPPLAPSTQRMAAASAGYARSVLVLHSVGRVVAWRAGRTRPPTARSPMTQPLDLLFAETARAAPDRLALAGDPPCTAFELERRVRELADGLRGLGAAGGRLGLLLPNVPAFPAAFYGILRAGGSAVMLNPLLSAREAAEHLGDSRARGVVTVEAMEHLVPAGIPKLCIDPADGALETEFDAAPGPPAEGGHPAREDREAAVIYTSAMDGWARGARLTHRNLAANLHGVIEAMQLTPDDCVL